jgi:outer membrane receptor protein involved in Fe transport
LQLEPADPRINLELGAFYYKKKMFDEATGYFKNLLAKKPDPEIKTLAEGYLASMKSPGGGKKWGAILTGGMQYDSNVPLAANGVQLPVGSDRKGDWRGVLNLGLKGALLTSNEQQLTGSYSLYQTLHLHLTDFNLTQNLLDVTYKRKVSPLFSAKISAGFESIQLGGDPYLNDFTIAPGLFATFQEGMTTGVEYRFRNSYFKNSVIFPNNSERDGISHALIISHRQPISGSIALRAGYMFEREQADLTAWSSFSNSGNVGLAITLSKALLFDVSMDAAGKKFDEILTGATETRSDTALTGAASLTWQATEHLAVSAGYHYTNNSSNIKEFEYNRSITSIMFQGRY